MKTCTRRHFEYSSKFQVLYSLGHHFIVFVVSAGLLLTISVNPRCGNFLSFYGTQMIHADYSVAVNLSIFNKTLYIFLLATVTNSRAYKQCEVTCKELIVNHHCIQISRNNFCS